MRKGADERSREGVSRKLEPGWDLVLRLAGTVDGEKDKCFKKCLCPYLLERCAKMTSEHTENSLKVLPSITNSCTQLSGRGSSAILSSAYSSRCLAPITSVVLSFSVSGVPENKYKPEGCGWISDFLELGVYFLLQDTVFLGD